MVIGLHVDCGCADVSADAVDLQLPVDIVAQNVFQLDSRRLRVQPGVIECRVKDKRLSIVDLIQGLRRGLGDDRAASDVELRIVGP